MKLKDYLNEEPLVNIEKKSFDKNETIRAVRQMLQAELDAVNMYEQISQATKIPFVKKVVEDITNEERTHAGEFRELLKKLGTKDDEFSKKGNEEAEKL